jgi:hypothetical protein
MLQVVLFDLGSSTLTCGRPGPRGIRCGLAPLHDGDHSVEIEGPPLPCEICGVAGGVDCKEPRACRDAREARARS